MIIVKGIQWVTKEEARQRVAEATKRWGRNDSRDSRGLSFRLEGVPGTGGGTTAWSYVFAGRRNGQAYYKEIGFAG